MAHRKFAEEIIRMYHGEEFIKPAEERYNNVAKGIAPDQIKTVNLGQDEINICEILVAVGFAASKGEAKRMIAQKGVKLDSEVVEEIGTMVKLDEEKILQFGKNKFVKIVK